MSSKSILIVSEAFEIGGLETHIRGEIIALVNLGWEVHFACGHRYISKLMPDCVSSITSNLHLNPDAKISEINDSIEKLRIILRENHIEYVHAHPFTSFFPAQTAAELERAKFIITLHGPASLNSYNGPIYDFLLNEVTFKSSNLVICVSEEVRQLAKPHVSDEHLLIQPNVISFPENSQLKSEEFNWLLISRLDQEKIPGIIDFIELANVSKLGKIHIAGDGASKDSLLESLKNRDLLNLVEFLGFRTDIKDLISKSKGVAGMGRVVLEGLSHCKPVILVGYNHVKGLLDFSLFRRAMAFNFSGRNLENVDSEKLTLQIQTFNKEEVKIIYDYLKENFEENKIWKEFEDRILGISYTSESILVDLKNFIFSNIRDNSTPFFQSQIIIDTLGKLAQSEKYENKTLSIAFNQYYSSFSRKLDTYFKQQIEELQLKLETKQIEFLEKTKTYEKIINELNEKNIYLNESGLNLEKTTISLRTELENKNQEIASLHIQMSENEMSKNEVINQLNLEINEIKSLKTELEIEKNKLIAELIKLSNKNEILVFERERMQSIYHELVNANAFKALKLIRFYRENKNTINFNQINDRE
jgi:hypothetical protein